MGVGEEAYLDQRNRDGGVAPGLQLAAINGQRGDAFDALRPLSRLLMVGELAPKGEKRQGGGKPRPYCRW